jgi:hypothetical protein
MRPQARIVPVPSAVGEGTVFEGRSFKIDQNALGAYYAATGKAIFVLISSLRKAELVTRAVVGEYKGISAKIETGSLTFEDEQRLVEIESVVSESTGFVDPQHCTAAIWAGLQHEWLFGQKKPLTLTEVGADLGPHITNDLLILVQEAMLPPADFPKNILEAASKNGDGDRPLTLKETEDSGTPGSSPGLALVSPTPSLGN